MALTTHRQHLARTVLDAPTCYSGARNEVPEQASWVSDEGRGGSVSIGGSGQ